MSNRRINLLPLSRKHALAQEYLLRLGTVTFVLIFILAIVATLLLAPTYVFLTNDLRGKETYLADRESAGSVDGRASSEQLKTLSNNVARIVTLKGVPPVSATIREMLTISREGITISGMNYVRGVGSKPSTIIISGNAASRDALRRYQLSLQNAPLVRSANLPVSAYARDTNIPFTITVTLTL